MGKVRLWADTWGSIFGVAAHLLTAIAMVALAAYTYAQVRFTLDTHTSQITTVTARVEVDSLRIDEIQRGQAAQDARMRRTEDYLLVKDPTAKVGP